MSPRGDEYNHTCNSFDVTPYLFPSPRGDEYNPDGSMAVVDYFEFPSPRGDEYNRDLEARYQRRARFRPLAGMSIIAELVAVIRGILVSVPSRG